MVRRDAESTFAEKCAILVVMVMSAQLFLLGCKWLSRAAQETGTQSQTTGGQESPIIDSKANNYALVFAEYELFGETQSTYTTRFMGLLKRVDALARHGFAATGVTGTYLRARGTNIADELRRLVSWARRDSDDNKTLAILFTGHGGQDGICVREGETRLSLELFREIVLDASGVFKNIIIFFNSCYGAVYSSVVSEANAGREVRWGSPYSLKIGMPGHLFRSRGNVLIGIGSDQTTLRIDGQGDVGGLAFHELMVARKGKVRVKDIATVLTSISRSRASDHNAYSLAVFPGGRALESGEGPQDRFLTDGVFVSEDDPSLVLKGFGRALSDGDEACQSFLGTDRQVLDRVDDPLWFRSELTRSHEELLKWIGKCVDISRGFGVDSAVRSQTYGNQPIEEQCPFDDARKQCVVCAGGDDRVYERAKPRTSWCLCRGGNYAVDGWKDKCPKR